MGYQIIKQPSGQLAIRASYTDTLVAWDATKDEVVEWFAELAATRAREEAERLADFVLADEPRKAYYQFVVPWEEAVKDGREHGGDYTRDGNL